MTLRVGINGYGRIGRNVLRALYESQRNHEIQIVAVNDLGDAGTNAHLTQYDTAHGRFNQTVGVDGDSLVVGGDRVRALAALGRRPEAIEEAWLLRALLTEHGLDLRTLATRTGRTVSWVSRRLGLVEALPASVQQILQRGLRPAVVRLYDELDTLLAGTGKSGPSLNQPLFTNLSGTAGRILGQLSGLVGKFELGRSPRPLELGDLLALLRPDAERAKHRLERWLVQAALQKTEPMGQILDSLLSRLHVGCLLIIGCEGEPTTTATEEQLIRDEIARLGGRDLGPEPGEHWLRHRYDVSFKWPKAFAAGAMADTMEFAATWDRLPALYQKVRAATLPLVTGAVRAIYGAGVVQKARGALQVLGSLIKLRRQRRG